MSASTVGDTLKLKVSLNTGSSVFLFVELFFDFTTFCPATIWSFTKGSERKNCDIFNNYYLQKRIWYEMFIDVN